MKITSAVCVAFLGLSLSGCQSLLSPLGLAKGPRVDARVTSDLAEDYFRNRYAQGRLALHEGNLAQAIDAFSQAAAVPELRPGALNGLAVAYAKLGRADLARRYFTQAIAADPSDLRFAANLARLDARNAAGSDSPMFALTQPAAPSAVVIHLPDFDARPAQLMVAQASEPAKPERRAIAPGVWLEARPPERRLANGAIRITLPQSRPMRLSDGEILVGQGAMGVARQNAPDRGAYPIRIALKQVPLTR